METANVDVVPPIHQWTHQGDKVLLVKVIGKDRKTGGVRLEDGSISPIIEWPTSGVIECMDWEPTPKCGHGIHAWPWGINIGAGKYPNANVPWLVLAVDPSLVVLVTEGGDGKVKVSRAQIVHDGTMATALAYTQNGRQRWIEGNAHGSASASGEGGSASASGEGGSASASGEGGSASASGAHGSASASGEGGSAQVAGKDSVASITSNGMIEVSETSIGAVWSERFTWKVHVGAVVLQRWKNGFSTLDSAGLGLQEGQTVYINKGHVEK